MWANLYHYYSKVDGKTRTVLEEVNLAQTSAESS